ncbi:MAG: response regulator [Verrucomicrobiota bacterium]|jgi:two-component system cell cycle response regulator
MMEQKILTVDDDKVTRLLVSTAFRPFACKVVEAADGVEGLALADREHPDIIVLDYDMPVMDGAQMLTRLKANPRLRTIPVLMLTAYSQRDCVVRILKLGVRDFLVKPFTKEQIIERVRRIIDLKSRHASAPRPKRSDEPLAILVVDDKPAIIELIQKAFAATPWQVRGVTQADQAVEACNRALPDLLLVSLSLPDSSGFSLFETLRASTRTKGVPVLALSVKAATQEQELAQLLGFNGLVTKPIELASLRLNIIRALGLDTSHNYLQQRNNALVLRLPANFNQVLAGEILDHLRQKAAAAVDAGLNLVVLDLNQLQAIDMTLIKLGLETIRLCAEFDLPHCLIASEAVRRECALRPETKDWKFAGSLAEALHPPTGNPAQASSGDVPGDNQKRRNSGSPGPADPAPVGEPGNIHN